MSKSENKFFACFSDNFYLKNTLEAIKMAWSVKYVPYKHEETEFNPQDYTESGHL